MPGAIIVHNTQLYSHSDAFPCHSNIIENFVLDGFLTFICSVGTYQRVHLHYEEKIHLKKKENE